MSRRQVRAGLLTGAVVLGLLASATPVLAAPRVKAPASGVQSWLTTADQRSLLTPVTGLAWGSDTSTTHRVVVDDTVRGQVFRGAGAALTESSAVLLAALPADRRDAVMRRLFSPTDGIGLSMLRQPLGATDFSLGSWTYDDLPAGSTDPDLLQFSTSRDETRVLPLLREAHRLQPALSVVATAWTAPAWMKTSRSLHGGSLDPEHSGSYARYLARSVAAYRAAGVPVTALTLGNEPGHDTPWYPSMGMSAERSIDVARRLPAALAEQGVSDLLVLGHDHNWDDTTTPRALLSDPEAGEALAGVAFHCYAGDPSAQQVVADAHPSHEVWMTECSGGAWSPSFSSNLAWNAHTLVVGNLRARGSSLLLWNLALDPSGGPTNGGCQDCRGVVTIDPTTGAASFNVEYYVLGQLTKAVRPGAVRIDTPSWGAGRVESVAFRNLDGSTAVVLHNDAASKQPVSVVHRGRALSLTLAAGAVQTLLW